jgi:hypothetical protein
MNLHCSDILLLVPHFSAKKIKHCKKKAEALCMSILFQLTPHTIVSRSGLYFSFPPRVVAYGSFNSLDDLTTATKGQARR